MLCKSKNDTEWIISPPCEASVGSLMVCFSYVWYWVLIIAHFIYSWNQGTPAHNSSFVMPQKGAMARKHLVCNYWRFFWNNIHLESRSCNIMANISHLEKEMVKVIVVKTASPRVYTVSAGWRGDRRRQICHRILKFALYKCIQKVTVLLLCRSLPHLNLIITALC